MPPGFGRARITRRAASGLHDRATRRGATAVTATTDGSREPPDAAVTAAADPDRRAQPYGRAKRRLPDRRTHDHTLCGVAVSRDAPRHLCAFSSDIRYFDSASISALLSCDVLPCVSLITMMWFAASAG